MPPTHPNRPTITTCVAFTNDSYYRSRIMAARQAFPPYDNDPRRARAICLRLISDPNCPLVCRAKCHMLLAYSTDTLQVIIPHMEAAVALYCRLLEAEPQSEYLETSLKGALYILEMANRREDEEMGSR